VAFRVLAGGQHPDHSRIAAFRKDHLKALRGFFVSVLLLCQKAARAVCEAWIAAYGRNAASRKPDQAQTFFEQALEEFGAAEPAET